mmetsp:Transcript_212/g.715  ORF Transcript_212/g.715 Transcript_212/m.715 type:complete len:112 (-) Transcript_212:1956-2291(-)
MTMILEHFITVLNLCATKTLVLSLAISSKLSNICDSVAVSNADVASSATKTLGDFKNARAMATLCFSPPDNITPLSPTFVFKPSGKSPMVFSNFAAWQARSTSSSEAFGRP